MRNPQMNKSCLLFLLSAAVAGSSLAAGGASAVTDGKKPLTTVRKGLDGGKVLCLSNRGHSQMSSAVFVSPKGRVAVVDGGQYADADSLRTVLKALGGKVDFWFLTHAHEDHCGALAAILEEHPDLDGISVGQLCFTFPGLDWTDRAEPSSKPHTRRFRAALDKASPALPVRPLRKGQSFDLGDGWTFRVLNDMNLPTERLNINDTSICLSVTTGGRKWLVTGDVAVQTGRKLVADLGAELEHEFVFMAHHGQQGADKSFYAAVKPKTAIWPTPDWLWDNDCGKGPGSGPWKTNQTKCWMQELGVREQHVLDHDVLFD